MERPVAAAVLTAIAAALLALWFALLSVAVVARRSSGNTLHGDGGDRVLQHRIRAHGNFSEYVPLALLVIGLLEMAGGSPTLVLILLALLLLGRVLHPFGMGAAPNSVRQFGCRGLGMLLTLLVLVAGAVALLVRVG